ncbi:hypothetical protein [Salinisphaera orenii]|uniref:DUF2752 domain-containing protein n=1 Tax=Salinisphaera orenii YIM 95161 TaxID=1051139 RepID=A0A423PRI8_9GAMM|nr:hypothetical protein [Salinisphaera halophila]ROO28229.1 hypothetical protein SAHL_10705 [Salinisphaera halophila YIM 95161]
MKACCPTCGQIGDLMQFVAEGDARKTMALALKWPAPLADALVRYLQLFQPPQRALAWSRAHRLMAELHADIERGAIERHGRTWAAPQPVWQTALQTVVARRDELTLPLKDHAYLYEIICRGANKAEAETEDAREKQRRNRGARAAAERREADQHGAPVPAKPPGGSLKNALAEARAATQSPTTEGSDS